jgi:hypothetical protein
MLKKNKIYIFSIFASLVFILFFTLYNKVVIKECYLIQNNMKKEKISLPFSKRSDGDKNYTYECNINSYYSQTAKIGIALDDSLDTLIFNNQPISLEHTRKLYGQEKLDDWKRGYPLFFL